MILREGTNDATSMVQDLEEYNALPVYPGDTVLDIGGHIGLFALKMYALGASRVISVEPEPNNVEVHRQNLRDYRQHLLIEAACIGENLPSTTLYVNNGRNKGRHSVQYFNNSRPITVATVEFSRLIQLAPFDVLKVDCEGAEYGFDWAELLIQGAKFRSVAVEYHNLPNREWEEIDGVLKCLKLKRTYFTQQDRSYKLAVYT